MLTPVNLNNVVVFQFPFSHTFSHFFQTAIMFIQMTAIRVIVARLSLLYLALGTLPAAASLCLSTPGANLSFIF